MICIIFSMVMLAYFLLGSIDMQRWLLLQPHLDEDVVLHIHPT